MPKVNKISNLKNLLELQKTDELRDITIIKDYIDKHFIGDNFGGKAPTTDYRIMNIMNEWKDMFSFSPGLVDGIDLIIDLLDKIVEKPRIELMEIYKLEEWKKVINLRGPVETVIEKQCKKCNNIFYVMGVSGFLDGTGLVCNNCGGVFFKSFYDDTEIPECVCGGNYIDQCPFCSHISAVTVGYRSPYWYFRNHKYIIGKGF